MKVIAKPRRAGKTTELIKLASKGRYKLIVCMNQREVDSVWKHILQLYDDKEIDNCPPQPITFAEFLQNRYAMGRNIEAFLIDNVEMFIQSLTHIPIEAFSVTYSEWENEQKIELKRDPKERFEERYLGKWPDQGKEEV